MMSSIPSHLILIANSHLIAMKVMMPHLHRGSFVPTTTLTLKKLNYSLLSMLSVLVELLVRQVLLGMVTTNPTNLLVMANSLRFTWFKTIVLRELRQTFLCLIEVNWVALPIVRLVLVSLSHHLVCPLLWPLISSINNLFILALHVGFLPSTLHNVYLLLLSLPNP
jgi:hypothetical protein